MNIDNTPQPLIDYDRLAKLQTILGADYKELLAVFITSSQDNIEQIGTALRICDRPDAVFIAHKFASAAAQFALPGLSQLGRAIEHGEHLDNAGLLKLHGELASQFKIATAQLQNKAA